MFNPSRPRQSGPMMRGSRRQYLNGPRVPGLTVAAWLCLLPVLHGAEGDDFFQQKIRPIFSSRCQGCHNDSLKFSGLTLESGEGLRNGGLHGPVVTPGDPAASRLYRKVARLEKPSMPMQGDPLSEAD